MGGYLLVPGWRGGGGGGKPLCCTARHSASTSFFTRAFVLTLIKLQCRILACFCHSVSLKKNFFLTWHHFYCPCPWRVVGGLGFFFLDKGVKKEDIHSPVPPCGHQKKLQPKRKLLGVVLTQFQGRPPMWCNAFHSHGVSFDCIFKHKVNRVVLFLYCIMTRNKSYWIFSDHSTARSVEDLRYRRRDTSSTSSRGNVNNRCRRKLAENFKQMNTHGFIKKKPKKDQLSYVFFRSSDLKVSRFLLRLICALATVSTVISCWFDHSQYWNSVQRGETCN